MFLSIRVCFANANFIFLQWRVLQKSIFYVTEITYDLTCCPILKNKTTFKGKKGKEMKQSWKVKHYIFWFRLTFWGPWWKTAQLFLNGEHTCWKVMEMGGSVLTSNLRPWFHSNFFYMDLRQNVSGCSFPCSVIPRGILTLLSPPSCSDVHVVVNWCGLKIITQGKKKYVAWVSSLTQFIVHL